MSSYNIYGGTPKKTLDLLDKLGGKACLYVYHKDYLEFKQEFVKTGAQIYEGDYGNNYIKHVFKLIKIIDSCQIQIVQTQFSMGEMLGFLIKLFRPNIKVICAFVGALPPTKTKQRILNFFYKKFDVFVYISNYVKINKEQQFSLLKHKQSIIIPNGTERRKNSGELVVSMKKYALLDIAGLVHYKNIKLLIETMNVLVNHRFNNNVHLYVAGDGPEKKELEALISKYNLKNKVSLLGYQKNVGGLLDSCDIFVHPCYVEGFGIVITEAMHASKPIIVSNAGALPELIEHNKTGLVVDPFDKVEWANAIEHIINNIDLANKMAKSAQKKAETKYTKEAFCNNYLKLYNTILNNA